MRTSSIPPPINRADKPKIPNKPAALAAQDKSLFVEAPPVDSTDRVSPFNTPPGSEGSPSPERRPSQILTASAIQENSTGAKAASGAGQGFETTKVASKTDPRFMGFSGPKNTADKRDARVLGFSSVERRSGSREGSPALHRSNTIAEPTVDRGRNVSAIADRHASISETARAMPSPVAYSRSNVASPTTLRDPRQFGFSNPTASAAKEERSVGSGTIPGLPPRRTGTEPPPRPSEDSKRTVSSTHRLVQPPLTIDRSTKHDQPKTNIPSTPISGDPRFPPPPKRTTFGQDAQTPSPPHRANTVATRAAIQQTLPPPPSTNITSITSLQPMPIIDDSDDAEGKCRGACNHENGLSRHHSDQPSSAILH